MAEKTVPAPATTGSRSSNDMEVTRAQEHHVPPPVDIYETRDGLILLADLPGVSKENLEVHVDNETLTIQAKAQHKVPGQPIYREYELSNFFRQFEVGDQIDAENIKAELKYGVLKLELPIAQSAKPKKVEVKVN
jgi:HSP20 family protein